MHAPARVTIAIGVLSLLACAPQSGQLSRSDLGVDADAGVADLTPPGADACASVTAQATLATLPVDVIFIIDNSGSMGAEIADVQANLNNSFADIIAQSGLDYRVILISDYGAVSDNQKICVSAPLSGNATCAPPPSTNSNGSRFFHYRARIESFNSLIRALHTYNEPDPAGQAPGGWSDWVRPDSFKVFVEISDDDSDMTAPVFDKGILGKMPQRFGDATQRRYVFHSIVGLKESSPATAPWQPGDPLQTSKCTTGGGADAPGLQYQALSQLTGGLRFPICQHQSFDAVFHQIATGVIAGAHVACEFAAPVAPAGEEVDLSSVVVRYTPSAGGAPQSFVQVSDVALCHAGAYYVGASGQIILCPETCAAVRGDDQAKIDLLFDCRRDVL